MTNWPDLFPVVNTFVANPTTDPETGEPIQTTGQLVASRVNDTTGEPTDPRGRIPYVRTDLVSPEDVPNAVAPFIYQDTAAAAAYTEIYTDPIVAQAFADITGDNPSVDFSTMTATTFANLSTVYQKLFIVFGQASQNPNATVETNSQGETFNYAVTFTDANGAPELTAVLGVQPEGDLGFARQEVHLLQLMQKNDYAKLSLQDQEQIAVLPAFHALASAQNLRPSSDKTSGVEDRVFIDATRRAIGNGFKFELVTFTTLQPSDGVAPQFATSPVDTNGLIAQAIQRKFDERNLGLTVGNNVVRGANFDTTLTVTRNGAEVQVPVTARPVERIDYFPGFPAAADTAAGGTDPADLFNRQVRLLEEQLSEMAIFSTDDIIAQVDEIADRYIRARYFGDAVGTGANAGFTLSPSNGLIRSTWAADDGDAGVYRRNLIDVDGTGPGTPVFSTFQNIIEQERVITSLAERRREFADQIYFQAPQGTTVQSAAQRRLDLPAIITFFQQMYNQKLEAEVNAATEEVRALNNLLNTYSAMQDMINSVLGGFSQDDIEKDRSRSLDGVIQNASQARVAEFFDNTSVNTLHPVERIAGLDTRPTAEITSDVIPTVNLPAQRQSFWSNLNNRLSDAVTQLNQQTQLKQQDISSDDRQKNRHFDLANNAQRKLA
ncbi:MAG: hypothetical protein AAFN17_08750, partial [Pseudomonadota bacterium]